MAKAALAAALVSPTAKLTTAGMPWPPYSGSELSAGQPASTICR